jgi:hypothetical protein
MMSFTLVVAKPGGSCKTIDDPMVIRQDLLRAVALTVDVVIIREKK